MSAPAKSGRLPGAWPGKSSAQKTIRRPPARGPSTKGKPATYAKETSRTSQERKPPARAPEANPLKPTPKQPTNEGRQSGQKSGRSNVTIRVYDTPPPAYRHRYYPDGGGVWALGMFTMALLLLVVAAWMPKRGATP